MRYNPNDWREIPGWPTYLINPLGQILSKRTNTILKPWYVSMPKKGAAKYAQVGLCKNGKRTAYLVHRLVAMTFLPEPKPGQVEVNHKNGKTTDNRAENLEWMTRCENVQHAFHELGRRVPWERPVVGINISTQQQDIYISISEAARAVGVTKQSIHTAIQKMRPSAGHSWSYLS